MDMMDMDMTPEERAQIVTAAAFLGAREETIVVDSDAFFRLRALVVGSLQLLQESSVIERSERVHAAAALLMDAAVIVLDDDQ